MEEILLSGEYYMSARKLGMREYNQRVSRGESGYLRCLDDIYTQVEITAEIRIPSREIPLSKIVGTYAMGRTQSFAANFMPLADPKTEFANKWMALCRAHMNEGIQHPIKVMEFLGEYYVMEGNKRVSVMKYFGAYSILADITRLMPQYDYKDPKIRLYYEFLKYDKTAPFGDIDVKRVGTYPRLLKLHEKYLQGLDEEARKTLDARGTYLDFAQVFEQGRYGEYGIGAGDAFTEYAGLYGFPYGLPLHQLQEKLKNFVPQMKLLAKGEEPNITIVDDDDDRRAAAIQRLLNWRKRLRVGFAYSSGVEGMTWSHAHELGRQAVQEYFGDRVETVYRDHLYDGGDAYAKMEEMALEGLDILFVTSQVLADDALKIALAYPKMVVFLCSRRQTNRVLNTYFGRYYEPAFLCGMVAGMMTQTDKVGYITPSLGVLTSTADVNAYALGAQMVNPRVQVITHGIAASRPLAQNRLAAFTLAREGVDILIAQRALSDGFMVNTKLGTFSFLCTVNGQGIPQQYLAAPLWNWGLFYRHIIQGIMDGTLDVMHALYPEGASMVSYWWGMHTGMLDIDLGAAVTQPMRRMLQRMRPGITREEFHPFMGPIYDDKGQLRVEENEFPTSEEIMEMDWFCEKVRSIPEDVMAAAHAEAAALGKE